MFKRKTVSTDQLTVASLRRSVAKSFFSKTKIKTIAYIGRIKKFYRDYRLPAVASTVFLALLLCLGIIRQLERTSLLALRNDVTGGGSRYSLLLSADEADQFSRDDTTEEPGQPSSSTPPPSSDSTQSTSNPFDLVDDTPSPPSTGGGGSNGGGEEEEPFSAAIDSFGLSTVSLQCSNPSKPNKGTCSKVYAFNTRVETQNGPGTVSYSWQSDLDSGDGGGSFVASSTDSLTTLSKNVSIACSKDSSFNMQFLLTSPAAASSSTTTINHNCNEL